MKSSLETTGPVVRNNKQIDDLKYKKRGGWLKRNWEEKSLYIIILILSSQIIYIIKDGYAYVSFTPVIIATIWGVIHGTIKFILVHKNRKQKINEVTYKKKN